MSQIPKLRRPSLTPKVFAVGVVQSEGPSAGGISPADLNGYEVIDGTYVLYYKGGRIGTAYGLVEIDGKSIIKEIAGYLIAMIEAADKDGIELRVTSGFRTMQEQQTLFNQNQGSNSILVSKPGYSTHQTGIAVDFSIYDKQGRVYEWLVKNAYRFGFIRTISNERWHWEYWGDWTDQIKPDWVGGSRKGTNRLKHKQLSMFSKVPRIHSCGDKKFGGNFVMRESDWWTSHGASGKHTDALTNGATNSWIGFSGEFLPVKFDRESLHWDKRKF
jgi:hypothetical protein